MAKEPKISVMLTSEAKEALAGENSVSLFLTKGGYLNCDAVEEHGSFQRLTVTVPHPRTKKPLTFQIDLPTHYVLYMLTAVTEAKKALGFKDE